MTEKNQTTEKIKWTADLPFGCVANFEFSPPDRISFGVTPFPRFDDRQERRRFLRAYFEARAQFIETVAAATGLRIAMIDEFGDGTEAISAPIVPPRRQ